MDDIKATNMISHIDNGLAKGNDVSPHIDIRTNPVKSGREAAHFPLERITAILGLQ